MTEGIKGVKHKVSFFAFPLSASPAWKVHAYLHVKETLTDRRSPSRCLPACLQNKKEMHTGMRIRSEKDRKPSSTMHVLLWGGGELNGVLIRFQKRSTPLGREDSAQSAISWLISGGVSLGWGLLWRHFRNNKGAPWLGLRWRPVVAGYLFK